MVGVFVPETNTYDLKKKEKKKKRKKKWVTVVTRTMSPTPPAIEISTPEISSWDQPPPPLLPLNSFCLGERCDNLSSPSGVYPLLYGVLAAVRR